MSRFVTTPAEQPLTGMDISIGPHRLNRQTTFVQHLKVHRLANPQAKICAAIGLYRHGAGTREILMTVLHTLKKRTSDVTTAFKSALDKLAEDGDIEPYKAVFSFDSS